MFVQSKCEMTSGEKMHQVNLVQLHSNKVNESTGVVRCASSSTVTQSLVFPPLRLSQMFGVQVHGRDVFLNPSNYLLLLNCSKVSHEVINM